MRKGDHGGRKNLQRMRRTVSFVRNAEAGRAKLKEKLETIKLLGTAACVIAVIGAAAASGMSGAYIPAAGLGDDSTAPVKKEDRS